MAGEDPVDTLHETEGVQSLGLQHAAVPVAGAGMHHHHHHVRTLFRADPVHILLDDLHDGLEMHPAPDFFLEPGFHVGIGITQDGNLQTAPLHHLVRLEIGLSVVVPDGVGGQEIHPVRLQVRRDAVIHRMSRLDVVVAHRDGIVLHVRHQPREQVRRNRVDVIEIVGGVVPLQAVARIDEEYVLRAVRRPDAVHIMVDRQQRRPGPAVHIRGVEPSPMDIVRGKDRQGVLAIFGTSAAGKREKRAGGQEKMPLFHHSSSSL